jgi:hypothetical protein
MSLGSDTTRSATGPRNPIPPTPFAATLDHRGVKHDYFGTLANHAPHFRVRHDPILGGHGAQKTREYNSFPLRHLSSFKRRVGIEFAGREYETSCAWPFSRWRGRWTAYYECQHFDACDDGMDVWDYMANY